MSLAGFAMMDEVYRDVRDSRSFPLAESLPRVLPTQPPQQQRHKRRRHHTTQPAQPPMQMFLNTGNGSDANINMNLVWLMILILVLVIVILLCSLMKALGTNAQLSSMLLQYSLGGRPTYLAAL